jgi:hypothetical protein
MTALVAFLLTTALKHLYALMIHHFFVQVAIAAKTAPSAAMIDLFSVISRAALFSARTIHALPLGIRACRCGNAAQVDVKVVAHAVREGAWVAHVCPQVYAIPNCLDALPLGRIHVMMGVVLLTTSHALIH